ncbi:MAG: hypothetical protein LBC84_04535 [Prevotellaceae bacterium]|jgi:hypothetical protein|nr:hypothetical protein [Prevotellaceae bacterium]
MLIDRLNLRKVATIVACLALTVAFSGCKDNDNGGGKIDTKLAGEWEFTSYSGGSATTYYCSFRNNGTFISSELGGAFGIGLSGNYTVSNGWITLTNVVASWSSGLLEENWLKTYKVEYRFEKHPEGKHDYLNMCNLGYSDKPELSLAFNWARWIKK